MNKKTVYFLLIAVIIFVKFDLLSAAAKPENVLVVINDASSESKEIGLYYQKARSIPDVNIMHYTGKTDETVDEAEYDKLVAAIKSRISAQDLSDKIDYIVLTKGTPLRVIVTLSNPSKTRTWTEVRSATITLVTLDVSPSPSPEYNPYGIPLKAFRGTNKEINESFSHSKTYRGYTHLYLVTRLDGFTVNQVKGLINNSIKASSYTGERKYLFDAAAGNGGGTGNDTILDASNVLKANGFYNVIYEGTGTFATGYTNLGCYFSWGSNAGSDFTLAKYQDLLFAPGAIGETYVSTGGRTFNSPDKYPNYEGQSLIADLVKNGISGVSGYTDEPGSTQVSVDILVTRYFVEGYNLAESFYMALTWSPSTCVLIGDPLCPLPPVSQSLTEITSSIPVNIYPQPFKASLGHTTIYFTKLATHTRLQIFNVPGELVYDEEKDTPSGQMEWNTLNSRGEAVSSGIYFYVVTDENNNIKKGKLGILR